MHAYTHLYRNYSLHACVRNNTSNICNCRNRIRCPLNGDCKTESIIFKAEVTNINDQIKT